MGWIPAELLLPNVPRVEGNEAQLKSWHYGTIESANSNLVSIQARWWPRVGSVWGAWCDQLLRPLPNDVCRFYYAFPMSSPGFMSVLYCHAGPQTSYATVAQGVKVIDALAELRKSHAIVCQATNHRLTERIMLRFGYVRHAQNLGRNHYIKRLGK